MTSTDESSWAQTLITVTPEDDAVLREITGSTAVSGRESVPLDLGTESIAYRRPLAYKRFVEPRLLDEGSTRDAENQTYLQGVRQVDIAIDYRDEASQTVYMGTPCPPLERIKHAMTSMRDAPVPSAKPGRFAQTNLTVRPDVPLPEFAERLSTNLTEEQLLRTVDFETDDAAERLEVELEVRAALYYVVARALWIVDPAPGPKVETRSREAQTAVRFDRRTGHAVIDNETQTGLTCEPSSSNTELLAEYSETRAFARRMLDEWLEAGLESRLLAGELLDEVVTRCANMARSPGKDRSAQTLATYGAREDDEEDLLRRLGISVVVDPLEPSVVVVPLIDRLLASVQAGVAEDARTIVKDVVRSILERTEAVAARMQRIRKESEPKSMDQIFDRRRKKIAESMPVRRTETASTQTGITGVREIARIKEPREVLCSVCTPPSRCRVCLGEDEAEHAMQPEAKTKPLRTQDILLAYKPCYLLVTESDQEKDRRLRVANLREKEVKKPAPPRVARPVEKSVEVSSRTIDGKPKRRKNVRPEDSITGWTRVIEAASSRPWSGRDSANSIISAAGLSSERSLSGSPRGRLSRSQCSLNDAQTAKALQVLKSTFCTQDTCAAPPMEPVDSITRDEDELLCSICATKSCVCASPLCPLNDRRVERSTRYDEGQCNRSD